MYGPYASALSTTFDTIDLFSFLKSHLFWLQSPAPYRADNHNPPSLSPAGLGPLLNTLPTPLIQLYWLLEVQSESQFTFLYFSSERTDLLQLASWSLAVASTLC